MKLLLPFRMEYYVGMPEVIGVIPRKQRAYCGNVCVVKPWDIVFADNILLANISPTLSVYRRNLS